VQAEIATKPIVKEPADQMIVGIDGAFVRATSLKNQRRQFEVVLGRIEPIGGSDKVFSAVRDLDDLARERVRSALRAAGRGPATKLTVLCDGEDAMRLMAGQWLNGRVEHRLDWFHLRRRWKKVRALYGSYVRRKPTQDLLSRSHKICNNLILAQSAPWEALQTNIMGEPKS